MDRSVQVVLLPENRTLSVPIGSGLSSALHSHGIELRNDCGGSGVCGQCAVSLSESPDSGFETVLACQYAIKEHVYVRIPRESMLGTGSVVSGSSVSDVYEGPPLVRLARLRMNAPSREDERSDLERLRSGLETPDLKISLEQLRSLSEILRKDKREPNTFTVSAILCENRLIELIPGIEPPEIFVAGIDVGTTTLAVSLAPFNRPKEEILLGRGNPQVVFGDDIVSRINKVLENPENLDKQRELILGEINEMLRDAALKIGTETKNIVALSLAGNTVMQQLFLGVDPGPLGGFPFVAGCDDYPELLARELGLEAHPNAILKVLPILGGFVGGDISAGIIATNMIERKKPALLIDIGTNGEMVLADSDELFATATAAGPAFEGARIIHGCSAVPGAISGFRIESEFKLETISGTEKACGICGSGLIDIISELLRTGVILPNGRFNRIEDGPFENRWIEHAGKTAIILADETSSSRSDGPVLLTQSDVREVQLASGAIRTGIEILLRMRKIEPNKLETLYLAGGFGLHINPRSAQRIGMIPTEIPLERIEFCGNTSLAGAKRCLFERASAVRLDKIVRKSKFIDLSRDPNFQNVFAQSMLFPK